MVYYLTKLILTSVIIVTVTELTKRYSLLAAILASLPLTSILALIWLQIEGVESAQIITLTRQIFWMVLPSLVFFLLFPVLLYRGVNFWLAMLLSTVLMVMSYFIMIAVLKYAQP